MIRRAGLVLLFASTCVACKSPSTADAPAETGQSVSVPEQSAPAASSAEPAPRTLDPRVYGSADASKAAPETTVEHAPERAPAPGPRRYAVAAMGDSLTDPKSHGGRYLTYLSKRCPKSRFDSYGKGGDMVNQMRRRFEREVFAPGNPQYTHLIVFGGVNDLYSDQTAGRTVEKIQRDLSYMYDGARQRGLEVIAVTVAPWGGFKKYYNERRAGTTRELNAWIKEQEGGKVSQVIDAYSLLACGERLCDRFAKPFKDGLHFGRAGHEVLGKALFEAAFSNCL